MIRNRIEDITKNLNATLSHYELEKSPWEKVEICKKKDGSDFAIKSKSFKNAEYRIRYGTPEINVYGRNPKTGSWADYSIDCYISENNLNKDDERRTKLESFGYFKAYILTVDEIAEKIKNRIEILTRYIENIKAQIAECEVIYARFYDGLNNLIDALKNDCEKFRDDKYKSNIEYAISETIEDAKYY